MIVDSEKAKTLLDQPVLPATADELRRQDSVFFVGCNLPTRQALETVFESDCQSPADLFVFSFAGTADFHQAEALIGSIKKNFKGYLYGQFNAIPSGRLIENAYAAGIDYIDIPLIGDYEQRVRALRYALTVFPRWSAISTLYLTDREPGLTHQSIDMLIENDILPLVAFKSGLDHFPAAEIVTIFEHLAKSWRDRKASVKPLQPLLYLTTPFAPPASKGIVHSLFDRANDARLRTASDLRRLLRVREVEESFESAGL
jgi:hypothetical protein